MKTGFFFLGGTGLHVADKLTVSLPNKHFFFLHRSDAYALPSLHMVGAKKLDSTALMQTNYEQYDGGSVLFCTTDDYYFSTANETELKFRIRQNQQAIDAMFEDYERIVFVAVFSDEDGGIAANYLIEQAFKRGMEVHFLTSDCYHFESRKAKEMTDEKHAQVLPYLTQKIQFDCRQGTKDATLIDLYAERENWLAEAIEAYYTEGAPDELTDET